MADTYTSGLADDLGDATTRVQWCATLQTALGSGPLIDLLSSGDTLLATLEFPDAAQIVDNTVRLANADFADWVYVADGTVAKARISKADRSVYVERLLEYVYPIEDGQGHTREGVWVMVPPAHLPTGQDESGTTIPPATQLTDPLGHVWTVPSLPSTPGPIYRDGVVMPNTNDVNEAFIHLGNIVQRVLVSGAQHFWRWNGAGWDYLATNDPRTAPAPAPSPTPTPGPAPAPSPPPGQPPAPPDNWVPSPIPAGRSIRRTILAPTQPSIWVPREAAGLHNDGVAGQTTGPVRFPNYGFGSVRSHDYDPQDGKYLFMAYIDKPGGYDPSSIEQWINHNPGREYCFVVYGTPQRWAKYTNLIGPYPGFPYSCSAWTDEGLDRLQEVLALMAADFPMIRYWETNNEPNCGNHTNSDQWTLFMTPGGDSYDTRYNRNETAEPCFYNGTARDEAKKWRKIREALPSDKIVVAAGWTDRESLTRLPDMRSEIWRMATCDDGAGGLGRDHIQALSFHTYMYGQAPNNFIERTAAYKTLFARAGFPAHLPLFNSEWGLFPGSGNMNTDGDWLARGHLLNFGLRIQQSHVYKHSDSPHMGFITSSDAHHASIGGKLNAVYGGTNRWLGQMHELDDLTVWGEFRDRHTLRF